MKKKLQVNYDILLDLEKIKEVYHIIKVNTRHKEKIVKFELFLTSNFITIYTVLKNKNFTHSKYNIFLITDPKCRVIMSEPMSDKIINHLVSRYILFPIIEPRLIDTNVATRANKGTKAAINYLKKYINKLKVNNNKIYALKCDIYKFFYSIDHQILKDKLNNIINDKDIIHLLNTIIDSTDHEYINAIITKKINDYKKNIAKLKISEKEKQLKYDELDRIPLYQKGKGLPIGNMTSQIMAIFYLDDLDHFIKEKLHIKYYIRYMDDLILIHPDKKYLEYCLLEITKKIKNLKLSLNNKTQIYEIHKGLPFLGYKFLLKEKKLLILINSKTKRRIKKRLKKHKKNYHEQKKIIISYNGYLNNANTGSLIYKIMFNSKIKNK